MATFVSPGVYTAERDFSLYVPALATTQFAIVGTASRGPTNERVLITTEDQLVNNFGPLLDDHIGLLAAAQYLKRGNQLTFVRVAGYGEAYAEVMIKNENESEDALSITASTSGSWANGVNGVSVIVEDGSISGTYKIRVKYAGYVVEVYDAVVLESTSDDFIETRMADSDYVVVDYIGTSGTLKKGTYYLSGGNDGADVTEDDVIGVSGANPTGLQLFADSEQVDVNIIAVPGDSRPGVVTELISIAESRGDCFALIDPPLGLDVQGVIDWHNGNSDGGPEAALNSSYAAVYWPWLKAFNSWTGNYVWLPPSGFVAGVFAETDTNYETWYAPAGWRRGKIVSAVGTECHVTHGERERLYGGRAGTYGINSVNPIVDFAGQGIVVWGQRTLQRSPTALDRVNVRRLLLYLRKVIATACQYLVFEPNDSRMWDDFKGLVSPFLQRIKDNRGLYDYRVVMDETTNTTDVIQRNEAVGKIMLKPMGVAEVINILFTLVPYGASFEEYLNR